MYQFEKYDKRFDFPTKFKFGRHTIGDVVSVRVAGGPAGYLKVQVPTASTGVAWK